MEERNLTEFSVLNTFAVPIITRKMAGAQAANAALRQAILAREASEPGMKRSNADGWHSDQTLLTWPEVEGTGLRGWIDEAARQVARLALRDPNKAVDIGYEAQGWANINRHGNYNLVHTHPGAQWSMVYYVDIGVPEQGHRLNGVFEFRDPRQRATEFPGFDFGRALNIVPEAGLFMAFPAWLEHMVHPFYGSGERISIAINVRFTKFQFRDLTPAERQAQPVPAGGAG